MKPAAIVFCIVMLLAVAVSQGLAQGVIDLPQTGQTICYRGVSPYDEIACAGTGQDGDIQAGASWPVPRFLSGTGDEADCSQDTLTGLMWPKNADLPLRMRSWADAVDFANTLFLCGYSDWRLPNRNELGSVYNAGEADSAAWLAARGFSNVRSGYYWSSTTLPFSTNSAWIMEMAGGYVTAGAKTGGAYVWPVRGGSAFGNLILSVSKTGTGTGTVTSVPAGIACGTGCSAFFSRGTTVTLTATPDTYSTFTGWSGGCTGTGTCTVVMNTNISVTANFAPACTYVITPATKVFPAKWGLTANLSVVGSGQARCPAPVVEVLQGKDWITATRQTWSQYSWSINKGTVRITATPNTTGVSRNAAVAIGDKVWTATQSK